MDSNEHLCEDITALITTRHLCEDITAWITMRHLCEDITACITARHLCEDITAWIIMRHLSEDITAWIVITFVIKSLHEKLNTETDQLYALCITTLALKFTSSNSSCYYILWWR